MRGHLDEAASRCSVRQVCQKDDGQASSKKLNLDEQPQADVIVNFEERAATADAPLLCILICKLYIYIQYFVSGYLMLSVQIEGSVGKYIFLFIILTPLIYTPTWIVISSE